MSRLCIQATPFAGRPTLLITLLVCLLASPLSAADDDAAPPQRVDVYGDPLPDGAVARLGTVRYRNCAGEGRIEFLTDGTLLSANERQVLWLDVTTGLPIRAIDYGGESTKLLAVSQDKTIAAIGTLRWGSGGPNECDVLLIETATGEIRNRLNLDVVLAAHGVSAADFSPDGSKLVTGESLGTLRVWDAYTGEELSEMSLPLPDQEEVKRVAISPDGSFIIACGYDTAYRWNWMSEGEVEQLGIPHANSASFSPHGALVVCSSESSHEGLVLIGSEIQSRSPRLSADDRTYYCPQVSFTTDGVLLGAGSNNNLTFRGDAPSGQVEVWNVNSRELELAIPFQTAVRGVAVSPDDRFIVACHDSGITAWELDSGQPIGANYFGHLDTFMTLDVSPDGTQVLTGGNEGWGVLWDLATGRQVHLLEHQSDTFVRGVAFSPDGRLVATSSLDDMLGIWSRATGERLFTLQGHGRFGGSRELKFSNDSRQLMSFGDDGFLRVFDVETGKALKEHAIRPSGVPYVENPDGTLTDGLWPDGICFTSDGSRLMLGSGRDLYLFNVETGVEELCLEEFDAASRRSQQKVLSPDDRSILRWRQEMAANGTVASQFIDIRELPTGEVQQSMQLDGGNYWQFAYSPDGTRIAAVSKEIVSIFDAVTGRELARIEPEIRTNSGVAFSPDGERLLVTHEDATVLVWDWRQFLLNEEPAE